jgi:hypothetical protein
LASTTRREKDSEYCAVSAMFWQMMVLSTSVESGRWRLFTRSDISSGPVTLSHTSTEDTTSVLMRRSVASLGSGCSPSSCADTSGRIAADNTASALALLLRARAVNVLHAAC